ncbi:MAG: VOC family protein [Pseudomonadota bacterium]
MTQRPGYAAITPYLVCRDAHAAIAWYSKHLGATERYRLPLPDGALAHAEIEINGMVVMIADEMEAWGIVSPQSLNGSPVSLNIYVEDCDATFVAMMEDGAEQLSPVEDQFHGDRSGKLRDPFGHIWHIATHKEAFEPDEIVARFAKMLG